MHPTTCSLLKFPVSETPDHLFPDLVTGSHMTLSVGHLFLKHVTNAGRIAAAVMNTRFPVPDIGPRAYIFLPSSTERTVTAAADQIPIFISEETGSAAIALTETAILSFETVSSTHSVIESLINISAFESLELLVTSKRQANGRGRRGERVWCSPDGCAMFSFSQRLSTSSVIGQHIGLLQHIVSLAVVDAVPQIPGLKIKWPNDVYHNKLKVAGVVVNCHMSADRITALIGVGINVDNRQPSDCLNRILAETSEQRIDPFRLIADVVSRFRVMVDACISESDIKRIKESYLKRWMHSNQTIVFRGQDLVIVGLDDAGFLRAKANGSNGPEINIGYDFQDISLPVP